MISHEFKPYADIPDMCVAELPETGDTCNQLREDHEAQVRVTLTEAQELHEAIGAAIETGDTSGLQRAREIAGNLLSDLIND